MFPRRSFSSAESLPEQAAQAIKKWVERLTHPPTLYGINLLPCGRKPSAVDQPRPPFERLLLLLLLLLPPPELREEPPELRLLSLLGLRLGVRSMLGLLLRLGVRSMLGLLLRLLRPLSMLGLLPRLGLGLFS